MMVCFFPLAPPGQELAEDKNGSDGAPPATQARQELRPRQIRLSQTLWADSYPFIPTQL